MRTALTIVFSTLILAAGAVPAIADPLDEARAGRDAAQGEVRALLARFEGLHERYERLEAGAARASAGLVDSYRAGIALDARLTDARRTLSDRARALYQSGPAGFFGAYLGIERPTDVLSIRMGIEHAFIDDFERIGAVLQDRDQTTSVRRRLGERKRDLQAVQRKLERLRADMGFALLRAKAAARRAGARVAALQRQTRTLQGAERRADERAPLLTGGTDQADLLAMLGPNGGRGCQIPAGLRRTGDGFSGVSSWYGWDFAGRPTASGAIYDPRLFTAAHRTLPLPSFLFVRHGDRCATVLVNDRGPFIDGRVLDLSKGAADYLGVGLSHIRAEILAPA